MILRVLGAVLVAAGVLGSFGFVEGGFNANSNANMAIYYGQNSRNIVGAQSNLAAYCQGLLSPSERDIVDNRFYFGCIYDFKENVF